MGEQGHAAVVIKFSHEGPQTGDIAGHLPCPVGVAIRPRLPGRSVLDPVRIMGVRADIEDLRG